MKSQKYAKFAIKNGERSWEEDIIVGIVESWSVMDALLIKIMFMDTKIKELEYATFVCHLSWKGRKKLTRWMVLIILRTSRI